VGRRYKRVSVGVNAGNEVNEKRFLAQGALHKGECIYQRAMF
jgi:hypothetical protein